MKKTILITGNAGLIGGRFSKYIIDNYGCEVIGIDNFSGGYKENVHDKVIQYDIDILEDIDFIFKKHRPEYVFHFAAYAAEGLSPFIRKYNYKTNLIGTANIINNCIKYNIKRLIFTSSMSVYGVGENGAFDETQVPNPIDPYAISKYACEMDIKVAGEQHGLDWCIIRPHNVYGIGQNIWDKYRNVIGIWMFQVLNNQPMTIYGDGSQTRAFSFIDDILEPLWVSSYKDSASKQIINLGGIYEYTINEANKELMDIAGGDVVYLEKRHEVHYAVSTYQKSIDILGFSQNTNLRNGLKQMWDWAKKQPKRERFEWDKYEIDNKIYSYWEIATD